MGAPPGPNERMRCRLAHLYGEAAALGIDAKHVAAGDVKPHFKGRQSDGIVEQQLGHLHVTPAAAHLRTREMAPL
jgi:hypothetical protein